MAAREDIIKVSGCSPEQRARWRVAAGDASLAAWMRHAADTILDGGTVLPAADIDRIEAALVGVRSALNASQFGNNINQVAEGINRAVKQGLAVSADTVEREATAALAEFRELRDQVNEALALVRAMRP